MRLNLKLASLQANRLPGCVAIVLKAGLSSDRSQMVDALSHIIELLVRYNVIANAESATDLSARWDRGVEPSRARIDGKALGRWRGDWRRAGKDRIVAGWQTRDAPRRL